MVLLTQTPDVARLVTACSSRASAADWTNLQAAIASARAAHGPDQYDAAFQAGTQMTYEQAVEHALRVLDEVIEVAARVGLAGGAADVFEAPGEGERLAIGLLSPTHVLVAPDFSF